MFVIFIDNKINIIKFFVLNFDVCKLVMIYNNIKKWKLNCYRVF